MSWFPIGPNSVFRPRDPNFTRLSRRNELGKHGQVQSIAFDPTDPTGATIYVTCTPHSGGASAFATTDNAGLWSCISLNLHNSLGPGPNAAPCCIAVNPSNPSILYMGDLSQNVYRSVDAGAHWETVSPLNDSIFKMTIDPRTAMDPATTTIIGVGQNGLYLSTDGGENWLQVISDDMFSLAAYMPANGADQYYAGGAAGLYQAQNPAGPWVNLNKLGIGLPDPSTLNFPEVGPLSAQSGAGLCLDSHRPWGHRRPLLFLRLGQLLDTGTGQHRAVAGPLPGP